MTLRIPARAIALALPMLLTPALANAQVALDKFEPAPVGDNFFAVQGVDAGNGKVSFDLGVLGDYARNPLALYKTDASGAPVTKQASIVSDQLFLHVQGAVYVAERVGLSLDFPVALLNQGDASGGLVSGAAAGDLRGGLRLRLFGSNDGPIGAALNGYVWFPTGKKAQFTGDGSVRGMPSLSIGGRGGFIAYGANGGVTFRPPNTVQGTTLGHELDFSGGVALVLAGDVFRIGPEVYGDTALSGPQKFTANTTNLEGVLGAKVRLGPMVLGAGAGPGLTKAVGTPAVRALLSLAYAPVNRDRDGDGINDDQDACPDDPGPASTDPQKNGCPDRDKDGIIDRVDACPDTPGVPSDDPKKNGCPLPPADRDHDGIIDAEDACPDVPGVKTDDPKTNGCPPDRDHDGIPDDKDACPDVPGVKSDDPAKNGCPLDTDGDGIPDDKDACPLEKGPADPDPSKNGCPKVRIKEGKIEILEQVQFKTGSDVILPASDDLLTKVSAVFKEHPEIKLVLVEGHTDDKGAKAYNLGLSKRRAASVMKWLTTRGGVEKARLKSEGFGMSKPIADNSTEEGRQKNRRVEFKILGTKGPTNVVH